MTNDLNLQLQLVECDETNGKKGDCPAVLNQLWTRQLRTRQIASDTAYAKKHSLEIVFGPKILASKLADRSNLEHRVA
jgi:hypothetical protein